MYHHDPDEDVVDDSEEGEGVEEEEEISYPTNWEARRQLNLGAQSQRGSQSRDQEFERAIRNRYKSLSQFEKQILNCLLEEESRVCVEYAAAYHVYSHSALLYELHTAILSLTNKVRGVNHGLPRIAMAPFNAVRDAEGLRRACPKGRQSTGFRAAAISVSFSIFCEPTVCEATVWQRLRQGFHYGHRVCLARHLDNLVHNCAPDRNSAKQLRMEILRCAAQFGLSTALYCREEDGDFFPKERDEDSPIGHVMQIFVPRCEMDKYFLLCNTRGFASNPFEVDPDTTCTSSSLGEYFSGEGPFGVEGAFLCNPQLFDARSARVRSRVFSANRRTMTARSNGEMERSFLEILRPYIAKCRQQVEDWIDETGEYAAAQTLATASSRNTRMAHTQAYTTDDSPTPSTTASGTPFTSPAGTPAATPTRLAA